MNNLNPTRGNNINIGIIIKTLLKLSPWYISLIYSSNPFKKGKANQS
ncbi:MAG: hypothetical protein ACYC6P_01765 [Ignavibacteriaceae bacterium]